MRKLKFNLLHSYQMPQSSSVMPQGRACVCSWMRLHLCTPDTLPHLVESIHRNCYCYCGAINQIRMAVLICLACQCRVRSLSLAVCCQGCDRDGERGWHWAVAVARLWNKEREEATFSLLVHGLEAEPWATCACSAHPDGWDLTECPPSLPGQGIQPPASRGLTQDELQASGNDRHFVQTMPPPWGLYFPGQSSEIKHSMEH